MSEMERALSAFNFLDPSCSRDDWVRIGMAAKSAGLDFEDFHVWSRNGANYVGEKDCYAAWRSFKVLGGITSATLFYKAYVAGWKGHESVSTSEAQKLPKNVPLVLDIWERSQPVTPAHEYIVRKQGMPDDLRCYPVTAPLLEVQKVNVAGYLVVPCFNYKGDLQTLQFIPPGIGGKKLNMMNASFNDGFFVVGQIGCGVIYLCEGIGQAWAIYQASGRPAVVSFGSARMKCVAKELRMRFQDERLRLFPDRGMEAEAMKIAAAVDAEWVELPSELPNNYDANDYAQEYGYDVLCELLMHIKGPIKHYKLLSGDDLLNAPPMRWLVQGVIPADGLVALYGASGSGKSFLVLDMGCAIAGGDSPWFGRRIAQAPVTYVCLEGEAGMSKRVKAWCSYHEKQFPAALRFIAQPFDLLSDDVSELAKAVTAVRGEGGLVIIDTLNRAAPGADENSSIDMGNIIAAAKKLQGLVGGVILLVHHTGKDVTRGLRGHSSLYAALDGAIEVAKIDAHLEWSVAKSKDDITGDANAFKLNIVQVGMDDKGDEITSCVVSQEGRLDKSMRRVLTPKSGNQKIIWEALGPLFRVSKDYSQAGAPSGRPCIRLDEAIEKTRGHLVCETKRQTERAQAAISGLVSKGLLGHRDGWLWVV